MTNEKMPHIPKSYKIFTVFIEKKNPPWEQLEQGEFIDMGALTGDDGLSVLAWMTERCLDSLQWWLTFLPVQKTGGSWRMIVDHWEHRQWGGLLQLLLQVWFLYCSESMSSGTWHAAIGPVNGFFFPVVVWVQLSPFSHHHFPPPHPTLPPTFNFCFFLNTY